MRQKESLTESMDASCTSDHFSMSAHGGMSLSMLGLEAGAVEVEEKVDEALVWVVGIPFE